MVDRRRRPFSLIFNHTRDLDMRKQMIKTRVESMSRCELCLSLSLLVCFASTSEQSEAVIVWNHDEKGNNEHS